MDGSSRDSSDRRIFLVANGPSLVKTPLDMLIGEESWGLARIHLIYDQTDWRPTRYWWSDHPQDQENMDDVLWHIEQDYECWVRRDVCEIITGDYVPSGPTRSPSGNWHHPALWAPEPRNLPNNVTPWDYCVAHNAGFIRNMDGSPDVRRPDGWHIGYEKREGEGPRNPSVSGIQKKISEYGEEDLWLYEARKLIASGGSIPLCKYGSGFNAMVQQAVLEGYNPIYLVGADLGFQAFEGDDDPNHFSPIYHGWHRELERAIIDNDTQTDMHTHAKEWCDERNIQILNASLGGELEVYPRVDFFSLF